MNWLIMDDKELKARFQAIPAKAQTALAAACAERVCKIWEDHWVGDYTTAVKEAIEFGWTFATSSLISMPVPKKNLSEINELVEYLNEEGIGVLSNAVTVSLRVLESVTTNNRDSALALERALGSALFVAKLAGKLSGQGKDKSQQEELDWQEKALGVAAGWQGACQRQMFDGLGMTPPQWWQMYEAAGKFY